MEELPESFQSVNKFLTDALDEARTDIAKYCEPLVLKSVKDIEHECTIRGGSICDGIYREACDGVLSYYKLRKHTFKRKNGWIEAKNAIIQMERAETALNELENLGPEFEKPAAARLFIAAYNFGSVMALKEYGIDARIVGFKAKMKQLDRDRNKKTVGEIYRRELEELAKFRPIGFHSATMQVAKMHDCERKTVSNNPVVTAMDKSIFNRKGGRPRKQSKT